LFESSATFIFLLPSAVTADSSILKCTKVLFVHHLHFNTSTSVFASISSRLYKNTFTQVSLYSKVLNATTSKSLKLTLNFPQCLPIRLHVVVFKAPLPQHVLKLIASYVTPNNWILILIFVYFAWNIVGDACACQQQASTLEAFFKYILSDTVYLDKLS
jgi:hypothetical protein